MARPKLGESETERLHLKITSDEVKAIDDWRYSNRVPSRSEAVRRLLQIGLRTSDHFGGIVVCTGEVLSKFVSMNDEAADLLEANAENATQRIGEIYLRQAAEILEAQILTRERVFDLARELAALHDDDALDASIRRADEARASSAQQLEKTVQALDKAKKGIEP